MPRTVTSRQLRDGLARYLKEAETGEEIVVTDRGRVVARLVPPQAIEHKRIGALAGQLTIPDDFDETPTELIELMEGGHEDKPE